MKLKGLTDDQVVYRQEMENSLRDVVQDVIFNIDDSPFSKEAIRQEAFDESEYDDAADDEPVSILAKMVIAQLVDELLKYRDAHGYRMFIPLVVGGSFAPGMWQRFHAVTCLDVKEYKGTIKITIEVLRKEVKKLSAIERMHKKLGFEDNEPITSAYQQMTS